MKKIYNPIAIYNYKDKKYFIALDENKIVYFKYENNQITNEYTKDELRIFMKVYNSIKINKEKSINLGLIKVNGKLFEAHYDRSTELYYWYEIIGGKRCTPSRKDLEDLDYKYNNVNLVYAEEEDIYDWSKDDKFLKNDDYEKSDNNNQMLQNEITLEMGKNENSRAKSKIKTITRGVVEGASVIAIVLISGYGLVTLADNFLYTGIKDKIGSVVSVATEKPSKTSYEDEVYKFEKIEEAVKSNKNLTDSEKDFIIKMKYYFDDNFYNFNLKYVEERLSTLEIKYCEKKCENEDVYGEYRLGSNEIVMYRCSSFENCDKSFLAHEIIHSTQIGLLNRFIGELSNELATRELLRQMYDEGIIDKDSGLRRKNGFNIYGEGYPNCMKLYYLLAELLDSDTLKRYQSSLSEGIIIDALVKIEQEHNDTELTEEQMTSNAVALLDAYDELRTFEGNYMYVKYTEEKYQNIRNKLDYYYKLKFDKSIDENIYANVIDCDYTVGPIRYLTTEKSALAKTVKDILKEQHEDYSEKLTPMLGDERYVVARTYLSGKYEYPILYTSMTKQGKIEGSGTVIFEGIEINPEFEERYNKNLEEIKKYQDSIEIITPDDYEK